MLEAAQLLTRRELARRLGCHLHSIDRWCRVGVAGVRLRRRRIGGKTGFDPADVEAWQRAVEAALTPAPPEPRRRGKVKGNEEAKARLRELGLMT